MTRLSDTALPGLAIALEVDAFLELMRQALPECDDELMLVEARIDGVHYRPGQSCNIIYKVKFRDVESGRTVSQLLSGWVLREDERPVAPSDDLLARFRATLAARRRSRKNVLSTPVIELPNVPMVVHAFPFDPLFHVPM